MNKKAQNITEYALVIAVVAAALLAMQAYFKRGVQSLVKVSADQLGGFGSIDDPMVTQNIAVRGELDPKYGALQSQRIQMTVNKSLTATTPVDGRENNKEVVINKWEETTKDAKGDGSAAGTVFYQELN